MKITVTEKLFMPMSELAPRLVKGLEKQGFKGISEVYARIGLTEDGKPDFQGFDVSFTREEDRA